MANKRIDRIRGSAGSMLVGDDSEGAVTAMLVVADKLFAVKEHAIYRLSMADEIDPDRTREDIPNTQQRVLRAGSKSPTVQATILTAVALFRKEYVAEEVDRDFIVETSMRLCEELIHAELIKSEIHAEIESAEFDVKSPKDRSFSLPAIHDISPRVKGFMQRIEHILQYMFEIAQKAIGSVKKGFFEGFSTLVAEKYPDDNDFISFAAELASFAKTMKNCRNAIEHPKVRQSFIIENYTLDKDMSLFRPNVRLIHDETPFEREDLLSFMNFALRTSLLFFENLAAFMASKSTKALGKFHPFVVSIPEQERREGVKFGYALELNGQVMLMG